VKGGKTNWGFESRELRKILGPNRDEVTGEWRRLYNEELQDLYLSIRAEGTGWGMWQYGKQEMCV
jgi:hypothetical protein